MSDDLPEAPEGRSPVWLNDDERGEIILALNARKAEAVGDRQTAASIVRLVARLDDEPTTGHRAALIRWLVAEGAAGVMLDALTANGNLVHAGCWDAPDVTEEQLAAAAEALDGASDAIDDQHACTWQAFHDARDRYGRLLAAKDRVTVYYENEDRPDDAEPLYRIVREVPR